MIKVAKPFIGEEEIQAVRDVLLSGNYASGQRVKEFEQNFAKYVGVEHAVAVTNGTAALHLILDGFGIGPGDEVIVPPLTFFSTVSSVLYTGATPVFADIDPETYCLDPKSVEEEITYKTKAVLLVHLYGQSADMEGFENIRKEKGLYLIEDCAQSHGTTFDGKVTGSFGDAGAFSFFATKHMTTGEGGLVTTNDGELAEKLRRLRSHGMTDRHTHINLGYNYRMTELSAGIGLEQLKKLPDLNRKRIKNSLYLVENLKGLKFATLPKLNSRIEHTFFWMPLLIDENKIGMKTSELVSLLREKDVETRYRYLEPLYRQKLFYDISNKKNHHMAHLFEGERSIYQNIELRNVENLSGKLIGLPNHAGMSQDELDKVISVLFEIQNKLEKRDE